MKKSNGRVLRIILVYASIFLMMFTLINLEYFFKGRLDLIFSGLSFKINLMIFTVCLLICLLNIVTPFKMIFREISAYCGYKSLVYASIKFFVSILISLSILIVGFWWVDKSIELNYIFFSIPIIFFLAVTVPSKFYVPGGDKRFVFHRSFIFPRRSSAHFNDSLNRLSVNLVTSFLHDVRYLLSGYCDSIVIKTPVFDSKFTSKSNENLNFFVEKINESGLDCDYKKCNPIHLRIMLIVHYFVINFLKIIKGRNGFSVPLKLMRKDWSKLTITNKPPSNVGGPR